MTLRSQIACLLSVVSIIFVATTYAVQTWIVLPAFAQLEQTGAERNVDRCVNAIERDLESLSNTAHDWGSWDDSYQYIKDRNETFAKSNLIDESFSNTKLNLICLLDKEKRIAWGESRDYHTLDKFDVPDLFAALTEKSSPITAHRNVTDDMKGILLTSQGPLLLASRPMITTRHEGPIEGSMVMGRFLNNEEVEGLAKRAQIAIDIWSVNQPDLPADARRGLAGCGQSGEKFLEVVDDQSLHAFTVMNDIYGRPALLVRVDSPRLITAQGKIAANFATGCGIAGAIVTLVAMWGFLQWRIVGPLQKMADHATRVGKQDDLKARLTFKRADEIGTLAAEFDGMVESLAESRKKVLDSAHRAGMAEIASEVLHNVGNAVNSANCSIEALDEQLSESKLGSLERATALLREQAPRAAEFFAADPRAPKFIDFLADLNEALKREHFANQSELARLQETIRHIRDAIAAQQTFAGRSDFRQEVDLKGLLDEVLSMNQGLLLAAGAEVVLDLPAFPELHVNKSKLTQVVVNLIRNAVQAMQTRPADCRRLAIAAQLADEDGIELEFTDTGEGFGDDVREKLFTHGFTTKLEGNGLGLHYCANVLREAGGHITAYSAGPGQGATFRLRLPHVLAAAAAAS